MTVPPLCNWSYGSLKEIIRIWLSFFTDFLNIPHLSSLFNNSMSTFASKLQQTTWRSRGPMGARGKTEFLNSTVIHIV